MVMFFRQIRDAIETTLDDASAGRFRVLGYKEKGISPEEILDAERLVRVYYSGGTINKAASATRGPFDHRMTFKVEMEVAKRTEVDLTVLQDPSATMGQVQTAWSTLKSSEQAANEGLDELWDQVFNAIMDARELDFDLSFPVGTRWLDNFSKDSIMTRGEYAVLTGTADITCSVDEKVTGLTPVTLEVLDTQIDIVDDDFERTGVKVETP